MQRLLQLNGSRPGLQRTQRGVTLIETLIALLIFALGMLGIAGLLSATVKYQNGNEARSNITFNISDIAERIRANVAGANGYSSVVAGTSTIIVGTGYVYTADYSTQASASTPTFSKDCLTAACTQGERAQYDVVEWRKLIKANLPGGAGILSGNVTNGFDVTVMWFDKDAVQGSDDDFTDTLKSNQVCTAADDPTKPVARFCCPAASSAPAGVRCYNTKVIP